MREERIKQKRKCLRVVEMEMKMEIELREKGGLVRSDEAANEAKVQERRAGDKWKWKERRNKSGRLFPNGQTREERSWSWHPRCRSLLPVLPVYSTDQGVLDD